MKKKYKDVYYDVPDVKTIKELVIHGVGEGKDQPVSYTHLRAHETA